MRIIAQTLGRYQSEYAIDPYSGNAMVVRGAIGAVILDWKMEDGPRAKRVGSVAHRDIQVVFAIQILRSHNRAVQREHHVKPALRGSIEMAGGIREGRPKLQRRLGAINRGRITIERVEISHAQQRAAIRAINVENIIH